MIARRHVHLRAALVVCAFGALLSTTPTAYGQASDPNAPANPTCRLFDARSRPANEFGPGDDIVVRAVDFPPSVVVSVSFDQAGETTELASVRASRDGGISTGATDTTVPKKAVDGPATITASDGTHSTTCLLTVAGASDASRNRLYAIWGAALVAFFVLLVFLSVRSWRRKRLESKIASLRGAGAGGKRARRPAKTKGEPKPKKTPAPIANEAPLLDWEDDDDQEWAFGGEARAEKRRGAPRPRRMPARVTDPDENADDIAFDEDEDVEIETLDEDQEESEPAPELFEENEDELSEPPLLPESFRERIEPKRSTKGRSAAVARLLRETKEWTD